MNARTRAFRYLLTAGSIFTAFLIPVLFALDTSVRQPEVIGPAIGFPLVAMVVVVTTWVRPAAMLRAVKAGPRKWTGFLWAVVYAIFPVGAAFVLWIPLVAALILVHDAPGVDVDIFQILMGVSYLLLILLAATYRDALLKS